MFPALSRVLIRNYSTFSRKIGQGGSDVSRLNNFIYQGFQKVNKKVDRVSRDMKRIESDVKKIESEVKKIEKIESDVKRIETNVARLDVDIAKLKETPYKTTVFVLSGLIGGTYLLTAAGWGFHLQPVEKSKFLAQAASTSTSSTSATTAPTEDECSFFKFFN